eukprot:scaffold7569_cov27-Tisochrysis_lutea.AAC.3
MTGDGERCAIPNPPCTVCAARGGGQGLWLRVSTALPASVRFSHSSRLLSTRGDFAPNTGKLWRTARDRAGGAEATPSGKSFSDRRLSTAARHDAMIPPETGSISATPFSSSSASEHEGFFRGPLLTVILGSAPAVAVLSEC